MGVVESKSNVQSSSLIDPYENEQLDITNVLFIGNKRSGISTIMRQIEYISMLKQQQEEKEQATYYQKHNKHNKKHSRHHHHHHHQRTHSRSDSLSSANSSSSDILQQLLHQQQAQKKRQEKAEEIEERKSYAYSIRLTMIIMMKQLLKASRELSIMIFPEEEYFDNVSQMAQNWSHTAPMLKRLWMNDKVQLAHSKKAIFKLRENTSYFYNQIDKISKYNYVPSVEDIFHISIKTNSGATLMIDGRKFHFVELNFTTNFESSVIPIFVCSICDFAITLENDQETSLLLDSFNLFKQMNKFLNDYQVILIFTKIDLFYEHISDGFSIKETFDDYGGDPHDPDQQLEFIIHKFVSLKEGKPIYYFTINACDTANVIEIYDKILSLDLNECEANEI